MHVITCRSVVVGCFLQEKEVVPDEFGGQPRETPQILTFSLSKTSLGAHSTYRMSFGVCFTLNACDILCTTCRILG
jgi:hypothetical protein